MANGDEVSIGNGLSLPPRCQDCAVHGRGGQLLPLSDYGEEGASVVFKGWICSDMRCGWSVRVDKGQITYRRIQGTTERSEDAPAGQRAGRRA